MRVQTLCIADVDLIFERQIISAHSLVCALSI